MNLIYPCICAALAIVICVSIFTYLWVNREKYVLLRYLGTNTRRIPFYNKLSSSKTKKGLKYKGHRYDRQHIRRPHQRY